VKVTLNKNSAVVVTTPRGFLWAEYKYGIEFNQWSVDK